MHSLKSQTKTSYVFFFQTCTYLRIGLSKFGMKLSSLKLESEEKLGKKQNFNPNL